MSAYSVQALARSPDRYFRLGTDGASSTMTDAAGHGNGTYNNAPPTTTGPLTGDANPGRSFAAASFQFGWTDGEIASFSSATKASLMFWMKKSASTPTGVAVGLDSNPLFAVHWDTDDKVYAKVGNGTVIANYNVALTADGNWHHIALVYDSTLSGDARIALYIDNVAQTLTVSGTIPTTLGAANGNQRLQVGHGPDGYHTGSIAEIQAYGGVALTSSQVGDDYTTGTGGGGDTTPPVLSSPVGTKTGTSTATIGATTDEGNGTLYGVVTTSSTTPTAAQVRAGQDNGGSAAAFAGSVAVSSTGAKTISATLLSASTTYYAHLTQDDAAGNHSNVVTSSSFTTDAPPPDTTPPAFASATTSTDGMSTVVTLTETENQPILPATGITGFTLSASGGLTAGVAVGIASAVRSSATTITLTHARRVYADETITVAYSSSTGNVTDSAAAHNAMATFGAQSVTNASTWKGAYVVAGRTLQPGVNYGNQSGYTTFTNLEFVGEGWTSVVDLQTKQVYHDNITGNGSVRFVDIKCINFGIPTTFVKTPGAGSITSDAALMHGVYLTWWGSSSGAFVFDRIKWDLSNTFRVNRVSGSTTTVYVENNSFTSTTTNAAESTPETSNEIGYFWLSGGGTSTFRFNTVEKGYVTWDAAGALPWIVQGNRTRGIRTFFRFLQCTAVTMFDNIVSVRQGSLFDPSDPGGVFGSQNQGCTMSLCTGSVWYDNVFDSGQWIERNLSGDFHDNYVVNMSSHAAVITPEDGTLIHHNIFGPLFNGPPESNKGFIVFTSAPTGVKIYNNTFDAALTQETGSAIGSQDVTDAEIYNNIFSNLRVNRTQTGDCVIGPDNDTESISGSPLRPASNPDRYGFINNNAFHGNNCAAYGAGVTGETQGTGNFATADVTTDPTYADPPTAFAYSFSDILAGTVTAADILSDVRAGYTPTNVADYATAGITSRSDPTPTYIGAVEPQASGGDLAVTYDAGTPIADGGTYDFGTLVQGTLTTKDFTLTNAGTATLTLGNVTPAGSITLTADPSGATITAGNSRTLTARITTSVLGAASGSITINSDDADTPAYVLNFTGNIVATPVPITIVSAATPVDGSVITVTVNTHGNGDLAGTAVSGVTYKQNGTPRTPTSVTVAGADTFDIVPSVTIADGDVLTVTIHTSDLTDDNGDPMQDVTDYPVTNGTDTTPPLVAAASISATALVVTFSEAIDAGGSTFAGFSISGTSATIGTPVFSGDRVLTFPVSGTLARTDAVKLAYNATTGTVLDAAGNEMISFSNLTVTNRLNGNKRAVVLLRPPFRFARLQRTRRT